MENEVLYYTFTHDYIFKFMYLLSMCASTHPTASMWAPNNNFWESQFSPSIMWVPKIKTQVFWLSDKNLYLLSHLLQVPLPPPSRSRYAIQLALNSL